jgi:dTDP-glucose 4,6-dehydratase
MTPRLERASVTPRFERALVTGGAGFLGSRICEQLLSEGTDVVAVDNFATASAENVDHLTGAPGFQLIDHDVTEPLFTLGGFDVVLHLASAASPRDYFRLDFATYNGARFVLASTSEVYGDPLEYPQRETYWGNANPIGPRSVYDESKRYAEALTMAYGGNAGPIPRSRRSFNT